MADEADFLLGAKTYDGDARRWIGNMLGANPWGRIADHRRTRRTSSRRPT
jgi:hypothetical protein